MLIFEDVAKAKIKQNGLRGARNWTLRIYNFECDQRRFGSGFWNDFRSILGPKIDEKSIPKASWKASALKTAFGSGLKRLKAAKRRPGSIGKGANGGLDRRGRRRGGGYANCFKQF